MMKYDPFQNYMPSEKDEASGLVQSRKSKKKNQDDSLFAAEQKKLRHQTNFEDYDEPDLTETKKRRVRNNLEQQNRKTNTYAEFEEEKNWQDYKTGRIIKVTIIGSHLTESLV